MRTLYWLPVAVALLSGCGGGGQKADEPVLYLLRADAGVPSGPQDAPVRIGLNRVAIAAYLGQPGIVVETGANQVRPARQHLWAEPLDSSVRLYLRDAISARMGYAVSADFARRVQWDYRIDLRIDEWHGTLAGNARIVAYWIVIDMATDKELKRHRFEQTGMMTADGYEALVATQTKLLDSLAAAVAESLAGLGS